MPIYKGNKEITAIYKGDTPISAIYKGDTLIFSSGTWEQYLYEFIYNSLVPTTINNKQVKNKARVKTIYANGVIENQLIQNGNFADTSSWYAVSATFSVSNNVATITPTSIHSAFRQNRTFTNGHKYLYKFDIKYSNGESYYINVASVQTNSTGTGQWESKSAIITVTNSNDAFNIYDYDNNVRSEWQLKNVIVLDLTQMFGTGNEPTSLTDTRVQKILNSGYISYNTGTYKGTDISEISTKDSNNVDLDTIALKYQGNGSLDSHDTLEITSTEYVFTKNSFKITLSGSETVDNLTHGTNFMGITNLFTTDIQPPLNYLPMFNKRVFNKGSISNLPEGYCYTYGRNFYYNIGTNDQQANIDFITGLEVIYQLATPQVIRIPRKHLGVVDLGSLSWSYQSDNQRFLSNDLSSLMKKITNNSEIGNLYCSKYQTHTYDGSTGINNIIIQYVSSNINRIFIRDTNYTDANTFKTAMSGIYLFYETQDEVTDMPFTIEVESGGTITTDSEVLPNILMGVKSR